MNKESENALQLLTGKPASHEASVEDLQLLADEHPYFAAAQLLLLQKMKQTGHEGLSKQLQKTALYFPNEPWLRYLLSDENQAEKRAETVPVTSQLPAEAVGSNIIDDKTLADEDIMKADDDEPATEITNNAEESPEDANLITLPSKQILDDISNNDSITSEPEEPPLDEEELRQQAEELPLAESGQKIVSLLSEQAEEFHKPVSEDAVLPIATEPFHTVDYFASQGIKLDAKAAENGFDKKVHKFTDWLRQMKRINPQPTDLGTETKEEQQVATIADSSNYTKKVLTESMAEVLVKQGKREKAIEIYQKLSLLNPDKSPYFADLIQKIR